jgi:hypothetical protein
VQGTWYPNEVGKAVNQPRHHDRSSMLTWPE